MISWDRVRELRREIGEDDFREVVELFLEEVEEVLDRMQAAPDPRGYEADLHFLKGSALNIGFQALGTLCRDSEASAAARRLGAEDIDHVMEVYTTSKEQFLAREPFNL